LSRSASAETNTDHDGVRGASFPHSRRDSCELRYVTTLPGPFSFSYWWYKDFQGSAKPSRKCRVGNQVAKMGVFRRLFAPDVAIDLGTANTLVFVKGRGVVLSEPSVVAIDMKTDNVVAVGSAAKSMIGRTPAHIVATQPLKSGVIADFEVTEKMLAYFIRGARPKRSVLRYLVRPRVAVCVPSGVTGVELRAVKEATESAGARKAYTIEEPLAAAIGVNLPVSEPEGSMVVDVGGGTTEVAVISLGGIVTKTSVRVAGNDMDMAIASHIQKYYQIAIGTQTAEQLKIELGSAFPMPEEGAAEVRGRDLVTGLPKTVVITSEEIREAIAPAAAAIVEAVRDTLNRTPPELGSDIMNRGMILAGGGALLRHLDERLREETGVPVHVAEEPLTCVAQGSGRFLEEMDSYQGGVLSA
jgi:rod shape-determining protein MreB